LRIMGKGKSPSHRIRVRLSAIINFLVGIYRTAVSFIFTVVVIRRLDQLEYGLYATLLGVANALTTPIGSWIYWGSRRHVLGVVGSLRATMIIGGLYLFIAIPLFIAVSRLFIGDNWVYVMLSILVMIFYILLSPLGLVSPLLNLYAPDKGGYLGIVFETVRLVFTYHLVVVFGSGVLGAVIGPGVASIVLIILGFILLARMRVIDLRGNINIRISGGGFREAIKILKLSILSIFSIATGILSNIDKAITSLISSTTITAAYLSIASVPKSFISPGAFTSGLYAKVLREPRREDVSDILIIYSFISIFLAAMLIALSKPAISVFNPAYVDGSILLIISSIEALILGYAAIFEAVALGLERADLKSNSIIFVARSALGKVPLAQMVRAGTCIATASISQYILLNSGISNVVILVMPYSLTYLLSSIPYTLYVYRLAISKMKFEIPWRDIIAFMIASSISSYIPLIMDAEDIIIRSFWRDLAALLPSIGLSMVIYVSISLTTSNRLRTLFRIGTIYILRSIQR
jgi:hypothetical protein